MARWFFAVFSIGAPHQRGADCRLCDLQWGTSRTGWRTASGAAPRQLGKKIARAHRARLQEG